MQKIRSLFKPLSSHQQCRSQVAEVECPRTNAPAVYALERRCGKVWVRYGLCGKRTLLERVRDSLAPSEQWRIVYVPSTQSHLCDYQKTA